MVDMLALDEPLQGIYDFASPGAEVDLHLGEGIVDGEPVGPVRVWLPMRRDLRVRWKATDPSRSVDLDGSELSIVHPQLGPVGVPIFVNHGSGWGTLRGADLATGDDVARVLVHWVNLPMILPCAPLRSGGSAWRGRWTLESCGWKFTLDSRRDLSEALRTADEFDEQFVLGHVGEVSRADGDDFDIESAAHVLFGWQLAMSFALGRWVAPALPVGLDRQGRRVWEQWAPWRCDARRGNNDGWWDTHRDEDLSEFFDAFLSAYLDPTQYPIVKHIAMHVITANHARTTSEGKVMLAQTGLEYLSWVTFVLSRRMTKRAHKSVPAASALRQLLDEAQVPTAVPTDLDALSKLADVKKLDGPDTAAWVRNRLTHPKDPGEPYRIEGLVWQTAQLLLEYCELLTLHRLGYRGRFVRRYPPGRWVGTSELVPWAP